MASCGSSVIVGVLRFHSALKVTVPLLARRFLKVVALVEAMEVAVVVESP